MRSAGCRTSSPTPIPQAGNAFVRGLLDDYAFTALACLDAYEVTGAMSYFSFAQRIADAMIARFGDADLRRLLRYGSVAGRKAATGRVVGPAQALPGFSHSGRQSQRCDCVVTTLSPTRTKRSIATKPKPRWRYLRGAAEQFGIYAGTYGIAATWLSRPHTQVVVVGEDAKAAELLKAAAAPFAVNKSVVHLRIAKR